MMGKSEIAKSVYQLSSINFKIEDEIEGANYCFDHIEVIEGVFDLRLTISFDQNFSPSPTRITWKIPVVDIHYKWNPMSGRHTFLDYMKACFNHLPSRGHGPGPVMALYDMAGINALTFALDDALHDNDLTVGLDERGFLDCSFGLFQSPWESISEYSCTLRIDQRAVPYYQTIMDVGDWWEKLGMKRFEAPESASQPFFCTWYSHRGPVNQEDVLRQAEIGRDLGIKTILIDAGWGFPYQIKKNKFPDMKGTIDRIHELGMKVLLWTDPSMPNESNRDLFGDEYKISCEPKGSKRLDPRCPEVRAHWLKEYLHCLEMTGCDGFKIDFLGTISSAPLGEEASSNRDFRSVPEAIDRAFAGIFSELRERKPDVMVEYRTRYHGPCMLQHCTMMRSVDCGNSYPDNRLRTIDLRLLCGKLPVHSDPIIWNLDEPVSSAALHLQHTLFAVPQVSVKLENLPSSHMQMLKSYLAFWIENRDVILGGELMPLEPQNSFPSVISKTDKKIMIGVFANTVIPIPKDIPERILIVNGTPSDRVVFELAVDLGPCDIEVSTCEGEVFSTRKESFSSGLGSISVPPSGYVKIKRF